MLTALTAARQSRARMCCWRWAGGRTPTTSGSKRRASITRQRGYIVVDDQLRDERSWHLGAGRLQRQRRVHAHVLQRLRDRRANLLDGGIRRRQRPHYRLRALHRPAARPRRHDRIRGRGAADDAVLVGTPAHDPRGPRHRERRDQRLDEDRRRREDRRDPRRRRVRDRRRRSDPLRAGRDVRESARTLSCSARCTSIRPCPS